MALFDDVLLAVDYDRTMTGPDSVVPQRNREAIEYFVENGGSFTVNTGRGTNTLRRHLADLQNNVPLLLYNGSMWYENGRLTNCKEIDLPLWETVNAVAEAFPEMNVEIQGMDDHYLLDPPEKSAEHPSIPPCPIGYPSSGSLLQRLPSSTPTEPSCLFP